MTDINEARALALSLKQYDGWTLTHRASDTINALLGRLAEVEEMYAREGRKALVEQERATAAEAKLAEVEKERDEAYETAAAHEAKWQSICKGRETCACSYDNPHDVCSHHSPQLAAALASLAAAEAKLVEAETKERLTYGQWGLTVKLYEQTKAKLAEVTAERDRLDSELSRSRVAWKEQERKDRARDRQINALTASLATATEALQAVAASITATAMREHARTALATIESGTAEHPDSGKTYDAGYAAAWRQALSIINRMPDEGFDRESAYEALLEMTPTTAEHPDSAKLREAVEKLRKLAAYPHTSCLVETADLRTVLDAIAVQPPAEHPVTTRLKEVAASIESMIAEWYYGVGRKHMPASIIEKRLQRFFGGTNGQ